MQGLGGDTDAAKSAFAAEDLRSNFIGGVALGRSKISGNTVGKEVVEIIKRMKPVSGPCGQQDRR
jgi:hypothetical protein